MIARHLEANGIPTVVMGCARDIVESTGVARFFWSDFPLGHSAGKPHDTTSQAATLSGALSLFDAAQAQITVASPQIWAEDERWKEDFMSVAALDPETLARMKAAHEQDRATLGKIKSSDAG